MIIKLRRRPFVIVGIALFMFWTLLTLFVELNKLLEISSDAVARMEGSKVMFHK